MVIPVPPDNMMALCFSFVQQLLQLDTLCLTKLFSCRLDFERSQVVTSEHSTCPQCALGSITLFSTDSLREKEPCVCFLAGFTTTGCTIGMSFCLKGFQQGLASNQSSTIFPQSFPSSLCKWKHPHSHPFSVSTDSDPQTVLYSQTQHLHYMCGTR